MFESEEITKIGAAFIQHSFGLRFAAVIIRAGVIKRAVKTAVQINAAGRALRLPSDKKIIRDFFFTFVTDFHESDDTNYL